MVRSWHNGSDSFRKDEVISRFSGLHSFLSNFYPARVSLDGEVYRAVEYAYQAAKTTDEGLRLKVQEALNSTLARRLGRHLGLRPGWEEMKLEIMENLVRQKFQNPRLAEKLLETGTDELIEGNWWGDTFWGVCNGVGENHLGKILMKIRKEL